MEINDHQIIRQLEDQVAELTAQLFEANSTLKRTNEELERTIAGLQLTEEALCESESKYRLLTENASDVVWRLDSAYRFTYISPADERLRGYKADEVIGRHVFEMFNEEGVATIKKMAQQRLEAEQRGIQTDIVTFEAEHRCKDGRWLWAEIRYSAERDEDGKAIGFHGITREITERKQNEQKLKASEEKHRRLFETMAQGVLYQAADGVIVSANPAAEKILGLTFEQMQGKTSMDSRWQMIEEDGTPTRGDVHPSMIALRTGQIVGPVIRGVYHPDRHSHVWLNITAIPLFRPEENIPYQVYSTFEDITERKEAQDALQQSLDRIEAIYAALDDAIVLVEHSTRQIIECNSATTKMFGYPYEDILGKDTRFMHVDQKHFEKFGREYTAAFADHSYYVTEFEMRRQDGSLFPTENSVRPVLDSKGQIIYAVSVIRDITKRKQAQLALEQKNQELKQFVDGVSHDLKSPLVTVKTFVGMLLQDMQGSDQPQMIKALNYIDKAADKMELLLDALLQYSRIGTVDMDVQTLSASQSIDECLISLAGILQKHQVQISTSELPQQLQGDPLHFGQIWQNLVENAVKYMGDQALPHIEIGVMQQAQDVVFYVRDNGMGIAPEHSERIFNLFSQLNPKNDGSGLGLALVKKIVAIYQGRIWVESAGKGQGSCFMFTLPKALIKEDTASQQGM